MRRSEREKEEVLAGLQRAGHVFELSRTVTIGDGMVADEYECPCGEFYEIHYSNGTRDTDEDIFLDENGNLVDEDGCPVDEDDLEDGILYLVPHDVYPCPGPEEEE